MKTLALILAFALPASAADEGAAFLKIAVGAKAAGLGAAQTASVRDASAIYWNPAGLAGLRGSELSAHHADLLADTRYDFVAFARRLGFGTLAVGGGYLSQGRLDGRDENRQPTGTFTAADSTVGLAFARPVSAHTSLGVGLKAVQSRIANESAGTAALDLGATWGRGALSLGVAAANLGPGLRFIGQREQLPLTLSAGAALKLPLGFTLAADFRNRPYSHSQEFGVGTEYAGLGAVSVRAGWLGAQNVGNSAASSRSYVPQGFAAGIGLQLRKFSMDYSFTPFGELGNAQRISLTGRF